MTFNFNRAFLLLLPVLALFFTVGCSGMDRMGSKMDMVDAHLGKPGDLVYEGKLTVARRVGDMVALQFKDGNYYDVANASAALYEGDVVRIYKTDDGYEARLWRSEASAAKDNPSNGS
jgi:hypothetical protein